MPEIVSFISWGSIFAGVILVLAFQFMFSVLDLSIGFSRIKPATEGKGSEPKKVARNSAILWVITSLIAIFLGTWVTGRLAGQISAFDAMLHGVVVWGLAVVISAMLMSSAVGTMLGGVMGMMMKGVNAVTSAAGKTVQEVAPKVQHAVQDRGSLEQQWMQMRSQIEEILRETGKPELQPEHLKSQAQAEAQQAKAQGEQASEDPQQLRQGLESELRHIMEEGSKTAKGLDKDAIANVIEKKTHMSHEKAQSTADRWVSTYQETIPKVQEKIGETVEQTKDKAEEIAEKSAEMISSTAGWSFVMLASTLAVAALGSFLGAV